MIALASVVGRFGIDLKKYLVFLDIGIRSQVPQSRKLFLPVWEYGFLDIHHLHVGSSVSSFIVLPDGTTILVDAGEVDVKQQEEWWKSLGDPYDKLRALYPFPNDSRTPVGWILEYLKHFWPSQTKNKTATKNVILNYLLVTHFHSDHIGSASEAFPKSKRGNYTLSGVPALVEQFDGNVQLIIDRGFPNYNFPRDLASCGQSDIHNYLQFVKDNQGSIAFESFQVGSARQIQPKYEQRLDKWKDVQLQIIKSGMNWDPIRKETTNINGTLLDREGNWNENTMSAAFVLRYQDFVYYEGGDQEIIRDPKSGNVVLDTIGPTARAVNGKVDVASLNHHGHGITKEFVDLLDPPVSILQGWCSDQPQKSSIELLSAPVASTTSGKGREIFATQLFPDRLKALGPVLAKLFVSTSGHVLVRVRGKRKGERNQVFEIFVLDGDRTVKSYHGPYNVRNKR